MNNLERHIELLLLSNDCVIVPDFGGFMAHHVDARYDEGDGLYLPPLRTLGFNPQLVLNDSLLVQSYVETYDISYPEALRRIENEVDDLRQALSSEGYYELNSIGTLKVNDEGRYEFEPLEAGILTPEYYALSAVEVEEIAANDNVIEDEKVNDSVNVPVQSEDVLTIKMSTLRYVAAAIITAVVFLLMPPQIDKDKHHTNTSGISSKEVIMKMMPKTVTTMEIPTSTPLPKEKGEDTDDGTKVDESVPVPAKTEVDDNVKKTYFTVVLASRVSNTNARNFVDRLQKQGVADLNILPDKSWKRVVAGRYTTENEAIKAKRLLSSNPELAECWVMEVKDNS